LLSFAVTRNPTAEWLARQITEASSFNRICSVGEDSLQSSGATVLDRATPNSNSWVIGQCIAAKTAAHVRVGSKAGIGSAPVDVCFTPKSGHSSA
jgi:hypothetical protein